MHVEIRVQTTDPGGHVIVAWTPIPAEARLVDPLDDQPVTATLENAGSPTGGRLQFTTAPTHDGAPTLALTLPATGEPQPFFVAGEFGQPSRALGDATLQARGPQTAGGPGPVLASVPVTVRVRKDATTLTAQERDDFLSAMGSLNAGGQGGFKAFRDMHRLFANDEEHGNVGFLPWHRAYLLDLERELQAFKPAVALPYWRFDRSAPSLFTLEFMGVPNAAGRAQFVAGHPFLGWVTDGQLGILRTASTAPAGLRTEAETINLGGPAATAQYGGFAVMEGNPHGRAHTSFGGTSSIRSIDTAAKDPLFFLLHCNVDRLWAKFQWSRGLSNPANPRAFAQAIDDRIGHRLPDTMWPWNGVTAAPRPTTAPGGGLASSPLTTAPGPAPTVGAMLDFQDVAGGPWLGFAYDDVPFQI